MDSIKDEMNQADMASLHHFYSRHIINIPDDQALTELFAQVQNTIRACVLIASFSRCIFKEMLYVLIYCAEQANAVLKVGVKRFL